MRYDMSQCSINCGSGSNLQLKNTDGVAVLHHHTAATVVILPPTPSGRQGTAATLQNRSFIYQKAVEHIDNAAGVGGIAL